MLITKFSNCRVIEKLISVYLNQNIKDQFSNASKRTELLVKTNNHFEVSHCLLYLMNNLLDLTGIL